MSQIVTFAPNVTQNELEKKLLFRIRVNFVFSLKKEKVFYSNVGFEEGNLQLLDGQLLDQQVDRFGSNDMCSVLSQ
jgi:hypothetical protein